MTRALVVAILLLTVPLVGCLGDDPTGLTPGDDGTSATPAPDLEPGTAFVYAAGGHWDLVPSFTVVVAQASDEGYLLTGQTRTDLVGEVFLERAWFGVRDAELNREPTDGHPEGWQLFDFPLHDGKTWYRGQQRVTAHAAPVPTPDGTEPGYVMTLGGGPGDDYGITYTYAPSVGYLTSYTYTWNGRSMFDISLTEVTRSETWTWYEEGPVHELSAARGTEVEPFQQAPGYDHLVVYAGGSEGTVAMVSPPELSRTPWTYQVDGKHEAFTGTLLEATQGSWTLALQKPQEGHAYLGTVAVRWIGPAERAQGSGSGSAGSSLLGPAWLPAEPAR